MQYLCMLKIDWQTRKNVQHSGSTSRVYKRDTPTPRNATKFSVRLRASRRVLVLFSQFNKGISFFIQSSVYSVYLKLEFPTGWNNFEVEFKFSPLKFIEFEFEFTL